jgi:hypothetical protein
MLTCRPIAANDAPSPPGPIVGEIRFRLDAAPGNGAPLPGKLELQVTYPPDAVPPAERDRLVLGHLDGERWEPLPDLRAEPAASRITVETDLTGVFGLYRRP